MYGGVIMYQTLWRLHCKVDVMSFLLLGAFIPPTWGGTELWDTAWLLSQAPLSTIKAYLSTRAAQGFNVVMMSTTGWGTSNEPLGNGHSPFLGVLPGTNDR